MICLVLLHILVVMQFFNTVSLLLVQTIYSVLHGLREVGHVVMLDHMVKIVARPIRLNQLMRPICELLVLLRWNLVLSSFVHVFQLLRTLRENVLTKKIGVDSFRHWGEGILHVLGLVVDQFVHYVSCSSILDWSLPVKHLCVGVRISRVQHSEHREHAFLLAGFI